jgi:hypothetical protein
MNGPRLSPQEQRVWKIVRELVAEDYSLDAATAYVLDELAVGPEDVEELYAVAEAAYENIVRELREAEEEADAEAVADINARHARRLAEIEAGRRVR